MIKRTFKITARIEQGQIPFCFQCVQNDKDVYTLHIRITEGDKEIDYTQVSDATITFALANGSVVQSAPERLSVSSAGITYQMGTSEIACPGKVLASIQLFGSGGERLTTARFQFEVVADLITPKAVQSESHFPLLQQLVADVEQLKQDIVDLQIPDGSIMDVKLSDAAGQIKQRFASHMAENVSQLVVATRDTTLAGIQTVSFTRKPKRIDVLSLVIGTKKFSVGNVSSNSQGCIFHTEAGAMFGNGNYAIVLGETEINNISGAITINADNTVSINWTKIGTGTTGTASIRLIAHYHD